LFLPPGRGGFDSLFTTSGQMKLRGILKQPQTISGHYLRELCKP
jgi:hypothetical protein